MHNEAENDYFHPIATRLDGVLEKAEGHTLDLRDAKYIIFSDQHRGQRDGADDFQRCERAYNAALAYYWEAGFTLIVLGDADELWESRPKKILRAYEHTFDLEARFHAAGRYVRIVGNHDDLWAYPRPVKRHLDAKFPGLHVHEGLRLQVTDGGAELGTLLLVHGHQGTLWKKTLRRQGIKRQPEIRPPTSSKTSREFAPTSNG